ncbi:hypothetical protein [Pseudoduganella sp. UC29_71]|uniref:hypothetical protein n=1 Tax=Pseudoduganella sp. UC29_71 TaxID=3350174 RepID=UPI00366CE2D9
MAAATPLPVSVVADIPLPGRTTRWDYASLDSLTHRLSKRVQCAFFETVDHNGVPEGDAREHEFWMLVRRYRISSLIISACTSSPRNARTPTAVRNEKGAAKLVSLESVPKQTWISFLSHLEQDVSEG